MSSILQYANFFLEPANILVYPIQTLVKLGELIESRECRG